MFNIVLYQPEIPQNTGNISRTCAVTGTTLHLIKPYGFELSERTVRRAGLDYWPRLSLREYETPEDFFAQNPDATIYYFSTKAKYNYAEVTYPDEVFLMFGKETKGLPEELLAAHPDDCVRIPMRPTLRSLNLSNSVAIAVYEVLRQDDFAQLQTEGELTQYSWD